MHLLSVWNPAYADDALTTHASLLRSLVQDAEKTGHWDDAFVWWGLSGAFKKAGFKEAARRSKTRPIMRRAL